MRAYVSDVMFSILKRKRKENGPPSIFDLNGNPLIEGDIVICHRYELGESKVVLEERQFFYEPKHGGARVSYVRMIDAITGHQKVTKKENP